MQKVFDQLTSAFRKNKGVLPFDRFDEIVSKHTSLLEDSQTIFLLLQASGYPIISKEENYIYKPFFTPLKDEIFCVIDIETNGSKPSNSQVIEIGAVKVQNGEIIERFETFVECAFLPEYITKITGIEPIDLQNAPSLKEALMKLRVFMQDTIFVAHNASFDYSFLNASFHRQGIGEIGNRVLCTIDLARRTFESERYGLAYLIESLEIPTTIHHRAYSDALSASFVLKKCLDGLREDIKTSDELIKFSTSSAKERK